MTHLEFEHQPLVTAVSDFTSARLAQHVDKCSDPNQPRGPLPLKVLLLLVHSELLVHTQAITIIVTTVQHLQNRQIPLGYDKQETPKLDCRIHSWQCLG